MADKKLESSLTQSTDWARERMEELVETYDVERVEDSFAIFKEFEEWIDPEEEEMEIFSMEFLGEGGEYDF